MSFLALNMATPRPTTAATNAIISGLPLASARPMLLMAEPKFPWAIFLKALLSAVACVTVSRADDETFSSPCAAPREARNSAFMPSSTPWAHHLLFAISWRNIFSASLASTPTLNNRPNVLLPMAMLHLFHLFFDSLSFFVLKQSQMQVCSDIDLNRKRIIGIDSQ